MKTTKVIAERRDYGTDPTAPPDTLDQQSETPPTSINQQTQPEKQHLADRLPKLGVQGAPGSPRQPRDTQQRAPGEPQRSSSRGCLREAKKAQGAPGARNGQFAKENVREKQHFGDRLQKLGFWGLQERKKAQEAPGARNDQLAN